MDVIRTRTRLSLPWRRRPRRGTRRLVADLHALALLADERRSPAWDRLELELGPALLRDACLAAGVEPPPSRSARTAA